MQKIICVLLMIVLLSGFVVVNADEEFEGTIFPTGLLKVFDHNAKEWMSSEENRALLAVCAFLDYSLQDNVPYDITKMLIGTTFVGRKGFMLVIAFNDSSIKDQSLMIIYDTTDNTQASYMVFPMDKDRIEYAMEQNCTEGYYKIDPVDLKKINDSLLGALGN